MWVQSYSSDHSVTAFPFLAHTTSGIPNLSTRGSGCKNLWVVGCLVFLLIFAEACKTKSAAAAPATQPAVQVAEVIQRDCPRLPRMDFNA
jgi:hypothetical protein